MMDGLTFIYRRLLILMTVSLLALPGCDIHEYPVISETVEHEVHLQFNAETMFDWTFSHDWDFEVDKSTKSGSHEGRVRYVIRLYPVSDKGVTATIPSQEYILYGNVNDPYGGEFTLSLLPGEYDMMVWADWEIPGRENEFYYDVSDFSAITLATHQGNTDYRAAFRGSQRITVLSDMYGRDREPIVIRLERPFAKFEIITNDLNEFITKNMAKLGDPDTKALNLDQLVVKVIYPLYMPHVYSIFTDKPKDSMTGVSFESKITKKSETEASLGFDYVFVNGSNALVTIQVAIYDKNDELLSLTESMHIPIMRNKHTFVKGSFLLQKAGGSIGIDPGFDGEFNIVLP